MSRPALLLAIALHMTGCADTEPARSRLMYPEVRKGRVEVHGSRGYRPTDRLIAERADQWAFAAEHTGMR